MTVSAGIKAIDKSRGRLLAGSVSVDREKYRLANNNIISGDDLDEVRGVDDLLNIINETQAELETLRG